MSAQGVAFSFLKKLFSNEPIWVVGGAVRDRLLKRETRDFDFVLLTDPEKKAQKFAEAVRGSAFRLDEEFAITRVMHPDGFRFDFGRIQGKTLEEDLDRRDFSVNALAVPLSAWQKS